MISHLQLSKWLNLYFEESINKRIILPEYLKILSTYHYNNPFHFVLFYYLSYLSTLFLSLHQPQIKLESQTQNFIRNLNRSLITYNYDKALQKAYPMNEWIFVAYWYKLLESYGFRLKKVSILNFI